MFVMGKHHGIGVFMELLFEKLNVILVVATERESVYVVCYSLKDRKSVV